MKVTLNQASLTFNDDGSVVVHGHETGNLELWSVRFDGPDTFVVLKEAGHTYWRGLGMSHGYAGVTFHVWRLLYQSTGDGYENTWYCQRVIDFPIRSVGGHSQGQAEKLLTRFAKEANDGK